jgi:hypothetical protein
MDNVVTEQFNAGDRVRLLAAVGDLAEGQKGTVLTDRQNGNIEVRVDGSLDDYLIPVASVEQVIPLDPSYAGQPIHASTGEMERTRAQYGIRFVRSGTPEELIEVTGHLAGMIQSGMSYRFMERYLMTHGYLPVVIRRAFQSLTGMRAEDVVNYDNYFMSPGTIPTFNHGWGVAKGGANKGWYFIMPMTTYYGIFHQANEKSGPSPRIEISRHPELKDAIEVARKLVRHLERWDPPIQEAKDGSVVPSEMYRQPQLFMHASAGYHNLADTLALMPGKTMRAGLIRTAFRMGQLSDDERRNLMAVFADVEADTQQEAVIDRVKEVEDDLRKRPIQEELSEKTPADFFKREMLETRYPTLPANVVNMATMYLQRLNGELSDFQIVIGKFKYIPLQPGGTPSKSDEPDLLNAVVALMIMLDIYDKRSQAPQNHKRGAIVFSVIGDQIWTPDTIKGEDNETYALSDEGLQKYFQKERLLAPQ